MTVNDYDRETGLMREKYDANIREEREKFTKELSEAVKREIDRVLPFWLGETADAVRYNIPDPGIYATQADLYRLSPILGTAVDVLGQDMGTTKFNVKRVIGEDEREMINHPFEQLLKNPNPVDSQLELMQGTSDNYKLNGNAIWWQNKENADAEPDEIWPIAYHMVQPIPDRQLYIDHYDYFPGNGKTLRLETWEVVHFKTYNPNSRFVGLSPLESLAITLRGDQSMRTTSTSTYAQHNGAPPSILAFKDYPNKDSWTSIKQEVRESADRNQMMMLRGVGDGVTWLQRAMSNKDADFIAMLSKNMEDVFNRMAPGLLGMLSKDATEATALASRATYSEKTLWPMMQVFAQKISSDILPAYAYGQRLVGYFDDPRVVDRKLQLEEQTAYERSHTIEEVRKEFYQDDPLGDDRDDLFVVQVNAQTGDGTEPPAKPVPPQLQNNLPVNQQQPMNQDMNMTDMPQAEQGQDAMQANKARADVLLALNGWQRKAVKHVGKPVDFDDKQVIPAEARQYINKHLPACKTGGDVRSIFTDARKMLYGEKEKSVENVESLLEGIRLALKGLELQK